jgi:hypothetical protein
MSLNTLKHLLNPLLTICMALIKAGCLICGFEYISFGIIVFIKVRVRVEFRISVRLGFQ